MFKNRQKIIFKSDNQTKNILFLVLVFIAIGLVSIFFTHQAPQSDVSRILVSQENYVNYIKPWMNSVYLDQSVANITVIKNNFLNFQGADQSIGPAHIALFLALDAWEKFLLTGDDNNKQQAIRHFSSAADLLPELSLEIKNLANILKRQNV
ncbi:MAG: hypothetical protein WCV71_03550 [Patescibacteria group bacterium]